MAKRDPPPFLSGLALSVNPGTLGRNPADRTPMARQILVCLKSAWRTEVPLRLDAAQRAVRADESIAETHPADLAALSLAFSMREQLAQGASPEQGGATPLVMAVSVGPPSAETILRDALAAGADAALRVWGRGWPHHLAQEVDGSAETTRLFAEAVAQAWGKDRPQLTLVGEKSADMGHACFGAFLAMAFGASYAHRAVEVSPAQGAWRVMCRLERGHGQEMVLPAPLVVAVSPQGPQPGYAPLPAWLASRRAAIPLREVHLEKPRRTHTTLRAPVPRVKSPAVPDSGSNAEARIQAMLTLGTRREGRLLPATAGTDAQVDAVIHLLRTRRYL